MQRLWLPLLLVFVCLPASLLSAQAIASSKEVVVLADSDMKPILAAYAPLFQRDTGLTLKLNFVSSHIALQQLQNGSPADIFFSGDFYFAEQAVASGLTIEPSPVPYAKGLLGLWASKDAQFSKPLTVDVLSRKDLQSVAIADTDQEPYGRAALAALKQMHLYPHVAPHLVKALTLTEAGQLVLNGKAELAFLSQSMAVTPQYKGTGTFALIPFSQYPQIIQTAVILKNGKNPEGAHRLLHFILSDKVQADLKTKGMQSVN